MFLASFFKLIFVFFLISITGCNFNKKLINNKQKDITITEEQKNVVDTDKEKNMNNNVPTLESEKKVEDITTNGTENINNMTNPKSFYNTSNEQYRLQIQEIKNNTIYFDFNKYNLSSKYKKILDTHASLLINNPSIILTIEGHTDERGSSAYNINLGEKRAKAIKMYLKQKGVNENQMNIISYGENKPISLDHNETSYAKNRRAVICY